MREPIHQHGTLEAIVRAEAERLGWHARTENRDIDPLEPGLCGPKPDPGRGDVVLWKDEGDGTTFEYRLPEQPEDIIGDIRSIIRADRQARDRLSNPARAARPLEV